MRFPLTMLPLRRADAAAVRDPRSPGPPRRRCSPPPTPPPRRRPPRPAAAPPADGAGVPLPGHEKTLANGLRDLRRRRSTRPGLVAYYTVVRTGSRNEVEPGQSGFAHFFEHMMFRGTEKLPAGEVQRRHQGAGRRLERVHHRRPDRLSHPRRQGGAAQDRRDRGRPLPATSSTRRRSSRRRRARCSANTTRAPPTRSQKMVEALHDNAFTDPHLQAHDDRLPEGHRGHAQPVRLLRQFFDRYYRPDNVVLLVVGDVEPEAVFALVEKHYGGWKTGRQAPGRARRAAADARRSGPALTWKGATLPMLLDGLPRPGVLDDERRPAGARRAGRAAVLRAGAAVQAAGASRSRRSRRSRVRTTRTSIPTCSPCSRASRSPRTSATSRRRSTTEIDAHRPRGRRRQDAGRGAVARPLRVRRAAVDRRTRSPTIGVVVPRPDRRPRLDQRVLRAVRQGHQRRRASASRARIFTPTNRTVVTLKADEAVKRGCLHADVGRCMLAACAALAAAAEPRPSATRARPAQGRGRRHPHRVAAVAGQPAGRHPPVLPGRLGRRSARARRGWPR